MRQQPADPAFEFFGRVGKQRSLRGEKITSRRQKAGVIAARAPGKGSVGMV